MGTAWTSKFQHAAVGKPRTWDYFSMEEEQHLETQAFSWQKCREKQW